MYIPGLDVRLTARYGLAILRVVLGIAMAGPGAWSVDDVVAENRTRVVT